MLLRWLRAVVVCECLEAERVAGGGRVLDVLVAVEGRVRVVRDVSGAPVQLPVVNHQEHLAVVLNQRLRGHHHGLPGHGLRRRRRE